MSELIQAVYPGMMLPKGAVGWHRSAYHIDIDNAAELVKEDVTYVQLAAQGTLKIDSSSSADTTQIVYVRGIDANDKQIIESKLLTGTTAVAVSATIWKYVETAWLSANCAGTIILTDSSNTTILTITIGQLSAYIVQHFTGEYTSYLTSLAFGAGGTMYDSVNLDLRWYPDDQSSDADMDDGYISIVQPVIHYNVVTDTTATQSYAYATVQNPSPITFAQPIRLPPGGWLSLFGTGEAANNDVWAFMQGYDVLE